MTKQQTKPRKPRKPKAVSKLEQFEEMLEKAKDKVTVSNDGKTYMSAQEAKEKLSTLCQPFRTKWLGAWVNNDTEYAHTCIISKEVLEVMPDFFRITVKKNKLHHTGDNRPAYNLAICGITNASTSNLITSQDLGYPFLDDEEEQA